MFSLIGRALDRTFINWGEKDRFQELKKIYNKVLSKIGLTFVLLMTIVVLVLFVWYKGLNPSPARFYQLVYGQSQPEALPTSMTPKMSAARVQSWLKNSLIEIHNMNFNNALEVLDRSHVVFRDDTYQMYRLKMTQKKGLVPEVLDKSLLMSLTPISEVRIIDRGSTGKYRVWKMQMIGLLVRTGSIEGGFVRQKIQFDVLVEEVPTTVNPYGLVIAQYTTVPAAD